MENSGLIFIDKPVGITSRDVDFQIMRKFKTKKVGHLGTLDPFASGLLIVGINEGTKLLSILSESEKDYEAELILGKKTNTGDLTGEVIETKDVPSIDEKIINSVLTSFLGKSKQTPPMFSAIKIKGKPLYTYARNNQKVEVADREIEIKQLNLIKYYPEKNTINFFSKVSKGTYIRTLGEDIAQRLNTVGYLQNLRRTAIDDIKINSDFISLSDEPRIISIIESAKIFNIPVVPFEEAFNGQKLYLNNNDEYILLFNPNTSTPIALYYKDLEEKSRNSKNIYRVKRGFVSE